MLQRIITEASVSRLDVFFTLLLELIEDFFKAFRMVPDAWEGDPDVRKFLKYGSDFECVVPGLTGIPARLLASLRDVDEVEKDNIRPTGGYDFVRAG